MTDQNPEQQFAVQKIYLKDVSFESPNSPQVFNDSDWKPEINVQINTSSSHAAEGLYEVVLNITVTATQDNKTAFLAEIQQAGLFSMSGFSEENIGGMLGAYCPEALFPFAREALAELIAKGGFPQLLLAPVNFNALYAQHLQQQQQTAEAGQGTAH
jgi:preprotein translocase subunit SecB